MPRFLLERPPEGNRVRLRGSALRHLRTVLRLGPGEEVELLDGAGKVFRASIRSVSKGSAELEILGELSREVESPLALTLAVALAKGPKLDWVVEKATELGVSRIRPFTSERTVPIPGDGKGRLDRWRRIAASAAAQCGRKVVPEIDAPAGFDEILGAARDHGAAILFREGAGRGLPAARPAGRVLVATGPEGGFSAREARDAEARGFVIASLGPRILRAETAAVVAVTLCQLRFGDLGG